MAKKCDNKSVGMLIRKDGKLLLIERMKFPYGFAPPAGHVDDFPSEEAAVRGEVEEEVGLKVESLRALIEDSRRENPCRREGGDHHRWWVYEVEASGELDPSRDETKGADWYTKEEITALARRTEERLAGKIPDDDWEESPGIEPIWYEFFVELGIVTPA